MVDPFGTWAPASHPTGWDQFPQYSYYDMVQANMHVA